MNTSSVTPFANRADFQVNRKTFHGDNNFAWMLPFWNGRLIRSEGQAPVADQMINQAHDNAGIVHDFYDEVLGRNSIDGKGSTINSIVHGTFPTPSGTTSPNNAAWYRGKMIYGDGDGQLFAPLTGGLDVVAHELTHGVTEKSAGLVYQAQSGALNESWSDVMGELVEQWHADKTRFADPAFAKEQEWLIGEDVFTPNTPGDALRSMAKPGTAYPKDIQPAHMRDYKDLPVDPQNDNGGVHINSGIPNKAAYEAAIQIGGEKLAKIWYKAQQEYLKPRSSFSDAAGATIRAASELYADTPAVSQAVKDAWLSVGVDPANPALSAAGATVAGGDAHEGIDNLGFVPAYVRDYKG